MPERGVGPTALSRAGTVLCRPRIRTRVTRRLGTTSLAAAVACALGVALVRLAPRSGRPSDRSPRTSSATRCSVNVARYRDVPSEMPVELEAKDWPTVNVVQQES
jgi:hypothetical protein